MRQRGRKSAEELAIVRLDPADHHPPPPNLSAEAAQEWIAIINRMPAGWFGRETHGLLAALCEHLGESQRISGMLATLDEALAQEVDRGRSEIAVICESAVARQRLLTMRDRETRAASSLATRMRLTPQAQYDKTKAVNKRPEVPPWEMQWPRKAQAKT